MKKTLMIYLSIIVASIGLSSCKKEFLTARLEGSWELRTISGGFAGTTTDYPEGNGNILRFNDNNYEKYINGELTKSGTYKTFKDSSLLFKDQSLRLVYDNDTDANLFFTIENNKLTIWHDVYDGFTWLYERKKD